MKLGEALKVAVERRDAAVCGKIADYLRFHNGMRYKEIADFANKVTGIDPQDWETLMYEADTEEASG